MPPTLYQIRAAEKNCPPSPRDSDLDYEGVHDAPRKQPERNMQMTRQEIKEKRTELVRVILEIERLKTKKSALTKALSPDFEANEAEYRSGVKTDAGLLFRRPSWCYEAKPVVEAA